MTGIVVRPVERRLTVSVMIQYRSNLAVYSVARPCGVTLGFEVMR